MDIKELRQWLIARKDTLHIRSRIWIFKFQQMLLDDPAIHVWQTVSVL
ncbi:MAG: hypothetical protein Q7U51_00400 [Methanoregula sp.]|nr:hypothetical protein [Methanoregula sp.]